MFGGMIGDFIDWTMNSWLHLAIVCFVIAAPLVLVSGWLADGERPGSRRYEWSLKLEEIAAPFAAVIVVPLAGTLLVLALIGMAAWWSWLVDLITSVF